MANENILKELFDFGIGKKRTKDYYFIGIDGKLTQAFMTEEDRLHPVARCPLDGTRLIISPTINSNTYQCPACKETLNHLSQEYLQTIYKKDLEKKIEDTKKELKTLNEKINLINNPNSNIKIANLNDEAMKKYPIANSS